MSLAQTGGVHQVNGNTLKREAFGDEVAGGARGGGDDGAFALDEPVEERRFADVGAADDGQAQTAVDEVSVIEGSVPTGRSCSRDGLDAE